MSNEAQEVAVNLFTANYHYASETLRSLRRKLTRDIIIEIKIGELLLWTFETGDGKYRELVDAYEAKNEKRIRRARQNTANFLQEYQAKRSELFRGFIVDENNSGTVVHKVYKFCELSTYVAISGSINDHKTVQERCKEGRNHAIVFVEGYRSVERPAKELQEELRRLTERFEKFRVNGGDKAYSEGDIRELVLIGWSSDYVNMLTRKLRHTLASLEPETVQKLEHAYKEMKTLLEDMAKHGKELQVGREEY